MKYLTIAMFLVSALTTSACTPESPAEKEKNNERFAIKLCWEEYEKKSIGPAEKQFIAGACEMMEKKFEDKHRAKPCFGGSCAPS